MKTLIVLLIAGTLLIGVPIFLMERMRRKDKRRTEKAQKELDDYHNSDEFFEFLASIGLTKEEWSNELKDFEGMNIVELHTKAMTFKELQGGLKPDDKVGHAYYDWLIGCIESRIEGRSQHYDMIKDGRY